MSAFTRQFPEGVACSRAFAPTGEPFVVFNEGNFTSEDDAEAAALQRFERYASEHAGTVYWRTPPEITRRSSFAWTYYMRLLISDREITS